MALLRCLLLAFLWMCMTGRPSVGLNVSQPRCLGVSNMNEFALECEHSTNVSSDDVAELALTILKGLNKSEVCRGVISSTELYITSYGQLNCQFQQIPNKISVIISGLHSSMIDIYFCKIELLYPPPLESSEGSGTIIYPSSKDMKCSRFSFLLIMGILTPVLILCMINIIFLTTKSKMKTANVNPVYEHMAPTRGR
ncbi:cytotoxic T-lymphocyte protein 4-like [Amblyraja radiata]|uniref:cytotoxic T-lymphocyte protein 4-like n=1 Tax=Amblyraja radiata TaxID=386614 RepID=UPI0014021FC5|nr:cytotoxic T-lymphocyte protein 4-like [Amblyraja radiata]